MKHPPLFDKMLDVWMAWPRIIEGAIQDGAASHEPRPGWLPVRDRSTVWELLPPTAYAVPGAAEAFNKELRRLHRRIKLSAFLSGMSRSQVESHLEVHAQLFTALAKHASAQATAD